VIIWLNGTFGVGKTTTAAELKALIPGSSVFDTEELGIMLRHVLAPAVTVTDFQHWRPWRGLVVQAAVQILDYLGGVLVIPQTVLIQQYWHEIRTGFQEAGIPLHHFLLHTDRATLIHRIDNDRDKGPSQWRHDHLTPYEDALPWLSEATLIDSTTLPPPHVALKIAAAAGWVNVGPPQIG
jgi:hypothetical protein